MKVLLTGALGFIGKNFLLHRPKSWQIVALDLIEDKKFQAQITNTQFYKIDLTNKEKVQTLSKNFPKFDACLYLAANGDPAISVGELLRDLQATTETLINVGTSFRISKLIYLSSGAVYDGNTGLVTNKTIVNPTLPYSISHKASEDYVRYFQKSGKIKSYVIIRFFGAYGPHEPERKIYTKFVKAFGIEKNPKYVIHGDGNNLIDAMYAEDAVLGFSKVITASKTNLTIDFCKGDHPNITTLVKQVARIFKIEADIAYEKTVPEYNNFYASPRKFYEIFHFKPSISLQEGIIKLYEHLKS